MKTTCSFKKTDAAKQVAYGIVYRPRVPDTHGDWADYHAIEQMAHDFNAKNRADQIDINHSSEPCGATVVESFIARKGDPDFPEGAWAIGVKCPDEIWKAVRSGEIGGFSMFGEGERRVKGLPGHPKAKHQIMNADISAVSLVDFPANRETFTMLKSDDPMTLLASHLQSIADQLMATNEAIEKIRNQQHSVDEALESLETGAQSRVSKAAVIHNIDPAIERLLRRRARQQERLEMFWDNPDQFPGENEADLHRALQKTEDKLWSYGHEPARADVDTGCAFFERGGSSVRSNANLSDSAYDTRTDLRKAENQIDLSDPGLGIHTDADEVAAIDLTTKF